MGGVVKGLDKALQSMDLQKVFVFHFLVIHIHCVVEKDLPIRVLSSCVKIDQKVPKFPMTVFGLLLHIRR